MVLKSVGVLSAGKLLGVMYAFLGLLVGGFMALFSAAGVAIQAQEQGGDAALPAIFFGIGGLIFFPLMYAIIGFIGGIITAALYNLIASFVGGIELEFERPVAPINQP